MLKLQKLGACEGKRGSHQNVSRELIMLPGGGPKNQQKKKENLFGYTTGKGEDLCFVSTTKTKKPLRAGVFPPVD